MTRHEYIALILTKSEAKAALSVLNDAILSRKDAAAKQILIDLRDTVSQQVTIQTRST